MIGKKLLAGFFATSALLVGAGGVVAFDATAAHASTTLVGHTSVAGQSDSVSGQTTECFGYTASASGTAADISAYVTTTDGVELALYADTGTDDPGTMLAANMTSTDSNTAGWVTLSLPNSVSITSGDQYWLCIGTSHNNPEQQQNYTVGFKDTASSSGSLLDYTGSNFTSPYTETAQYQNDPASIYVTTA